MQIYLIKRLLLIPVSFTLLMLLLFTLTRLLPGGPLERMLAKEALSSSPDRAPLALERLTTEQQMELKNYYGLDQSFSQAFRQWMLHFFQGDLGTSLRFQTPVVELIAERLPVSMLFGFASLLLAYGLCVPLAHFLVYAAQHPLAYGLHAGLWLASAIPSYVLASFFFLDSPSILLGFL